MQSLNLAKRENPWKIHIVRTYKIFENSIPHGLELICTKIYIIIFISIFLIIVC